MPRLSTPLRLGAVLPVLLLAACQSETRPVAERPSQLPPPPPPVSSAPTPAPVAPGGAFVGAPGAAPGQFGGPDAAPGAGGLPGVPDRQMPQPPSGDCGADGLQHIVGAPLTEVLLADIRARLGSKPLRIIRPGEMVTMDFSADRLNIDVDNVGRVQRVRCG